MVQEWCRPGHADFMMFTQNFQGPVHGVYGPETVQAVEDLQADKGFR